MQSRRRESIHRVSAAAPNPGCSRPGYRPRKQKLRGSVQCFPEKVLWETRPAAEPHRYEDSGDYRYVK
jgi:hypothetical protein